MTLKEINFVTMEFYAFEAVLQNSAKLLLNLHYWIIRTNILETNSEKKFKLYIVYTLQQLSE